MVGSVPLDVVGGNLVPAALNSGEMEALEAFGDRSARETAPTVPVPPREAPPLGPTLPEMRALSAAAPPQLEMPPIVRRKRRALLTVLLSTYSVALVGIVIWGVSWPAIIGFALLAYLGMVVHEVVLHRFLAHKAFRTSRVFRFVLTALAMAWPARGPIWWASTHRHHHRHADTDEDLHSPRHGLFHATVAWLFAPRALLMSPHNAGDLTRDREMRALERFFKLPFLTSIALGALAGWAVSAIWPESGMTTMQGLIWWGLLRALYPVLMMGMVNNFAHRPQYGTRRFATHDDTRNLRALAWLTAGASWHNNHHHYPHGVRAGFFPGEADPSYWAIKAMEKVGLVWGLRDVPADKLEAERIDLGADDPQAPAPAAEAA